MRPSTTDSRALRHRSHKLQGWLQPAGSPRRRCSGAHRSATALRAGAARQPAFTHATAAAHHRCSSRRRRRRRGSSSHGGGRRLVRRHRPVGGEAGRTRVVGRGPGRAGPRLREAGKRRPRRRSATRRRRRQEDPERPRVERKIPSVSKIGERHYYNFWTSAENPRGLLRRVASLNEFRKKEPAWEVVLDVDKLGKDEGESWSTKGSAVVPRVRREQLG